MPTLTFSHLKKSYAATVASDDVSFEVRSGEVFGLLGPNGAGKSTLIRMLMDIIVPDEGSITLDGRPVAATDRDRIGYLPEERGLYPKMRIGELLGFFGELRGLTRAEAGARSARWLERLELGSWRKNRVQDLSKGMQQKVQFAAALLHEPDLLILDEPWSGLDPINADVLREIVMEQKAAGRTILFSTHLMEQAEQICDQVCIIARGRKVLEGALAQVKRDAAGDRLVAIAFSSPADEAQARGGPLADAAMVAAVRERRGYLEVELVAGEDARRLLSALVAQGAALRRFELIEPTLHQIFVDRVGAGAAAPASH